MAQITDAVVLAAGEGRRLRPLTKYQPKPMLPVANRPIIAYVVDALREAGLSRLVVVVGHCRDRIQTYLTNRYPTLDIEFVTQERRRGSGHALQHAERLVDAPFVVVNGDNVIDSRMVRSTIGRFTETDCAATLAVAYSDTPEEYGVVVTDQGLISDIDEHPVEAESYLVNAGVYVFDDRVFDALRRTDPWADELRLTDAVAMLDGPTSSVVVDGDWLDPANPWQLLSVSEHVISRTGTTIADSARIHESAIVEDSVVVGDDCEVRAGAVVGNGSCLQENVHVGPNAVVERSILLTDAHVGAGALVRDSVVGPGARLDDGVVSPGGKADVMLQGRLFTDRRVGSVVADRARVGANAVLQAGSLVGPDAEVGAGAVVDDTVDERAEVVC